MDDITLKKVFDNAEVRDVVAMMALKEVGSWDIPAMELNEEEKEQREAVKMRVYRYTLDNTTERLMKMIVAVPNIKDGANPFSEEGLISTGFIAQVVQSVTSIMQNAKYYPYIIQD